jgi:hypothetical protein
VDRLGAKEDDAGTGNCNEDAEKRDNTGPPYMLDKDPEAGLVEDTDSQELVAPSWGIPLPSDASDAVEVGKRLGLDTAGDDRENIIDDDGRSLSRAAVDVSKAAGGKSCQWAWAWHNQEETIPSTPLFCLLSSPSV